MLMSIIKAIKYLPSVELNAVIGGEKVYVRKRLCHRGYVLLTRKRMFDSEELLLTEIAKMDTLKEIEDYLNFYYNIKVKL